MKKISAILIAMVMAALLPLSAFAEGTGAKFFDLDLEFENAPEGTYFIDLLVDMDETDSNYTEFNEPNTSKDRGYSNVYILHYIGKDSEIAEYNVDGYVSFALHNKLCKGFFEHDKALPRFHIELDCTPDELFEMYHWKAAYVDDKGNVLGVTDICQKNGKNCNRLRANGSELEYYEHHLFKTSDIVILAVIAIIVLAVVWLVIYFVVKCISKGLIILFQFSHEEAEEQRLAEEERMRR